MTKWMTTLSILVLGGAPEGNTVAEEKLRFFWQDEKLAALRGEIRRQTGLPE